MDTQEENSLDHRQGQEADFEELFEKMVGQIKHGDTQRLILKVNDMEMDITLMSSGADGVTINMHLKPSEFDAHIEHLLEFGLEEPPMNTIP